MVWLAMLVARRRDTLPLTTLMVLTTMAAVFWGDGDGVFLDVGEGDGPEGGEGGAGGGVVDGILSNVVERMGSSFSTQFSYHKQSPDGKRTVAPLPKPFR